MSLFGRRTLLLTGAAALAVGPSFAATGGYQVPNHLRPRIVDIKDRFRPNEIHVDPGQFALYWTLPDGKAIRYCVGIGMEDRYHSGTFRIGRKAEWPRWTPTAAMIRREPQIYGPVASGLVAMKRAPALIRRIALVRFSKLKLRVSPSTT